MQAIRRGTVTFGLRPPVAASYCQRNHSNVSVHSDRSRPWPRMQLQFMSSTPTKNRRGQSYLQAYIATHQVDRDESA